LPGFCTVHSHPTLHQLHDLDAKPLRLDRVDQSLTRQKLLVRGTADQAGGCSAGVSAGGAGADVRRIGIRLG
jgi:hypothetical protein